MDNIRWTIAALIDSVTHHGTSSAEFSVRQLSGKGLPGGKGKIELILAKKKLARALHCHAASMRYSEQLQNYLDRWCVGIHLFREDMGPRHPSDTRPIDS